jgi:hypothetical protein
MVSSKMIFYVFVLYQVVILLSIVPNSEIFLDYYPGDIGFDPLGLKPEDPEELNLMITKELQNGRLAMLAAAGFLAQEAVDGKGILEHLGVSL